MEDLRCKAYLVAGDHVTEALATMSYASVVSPDTIHLALSIAALNDLKVKCGDVMNAYITAPVQEKIWTVLGPEFGKDEDKKAIIVRSLYGLKSSGAVFRAHLAVCMKELGYEPCLADSDLWLKAEVGSDDEFKYYSYILCYLDDILVVHHDAVSILNHIDKFMTLKPPKIENDPDIYLGANLKKMTQTNGV
ncbi:hypothetical protein ACHAWF_008245 [Thalassiosira exigua]